MAADVSSRRTFEYFAFGSNLLTERIHINNPSACKVGIGKLKNYRLDFNYLSERWKGAVATVVEDAGNYVYGIIWRLSLEDLKNLDNQESVHIGVYQPLEVMVEMQNGEHIKARAYQLIKLDAADPRPSHIYLNVILKGAKEHGLPEEYVKKLEKIQHNGYRGTVDVKVSLPEIESQLCPLSSP